MTERPPAPTRPCAAAGCECACLDPDHAVNAAPAGALPHPVPLCPEHWTHVARGGAWFATERPGDRATRGVEVLTGDELVRRGLVVAEGDGLTWQRGGFCAPLAADRNLGVLSVDGRVYGSAEPVRLDLVLTPDAVRRLRSVLALYPEAADPR